MIKNIAFLILFFALVGCHRKTVPAKESIPPVTAAPIHTPLIVVDGYGHILTPKNKLPEGENITAEYWKFAYPFSQNQIANLKFRFKTVPPKVLYIPKQYTLQSLRGTYCIYKKKFWYWKKNDGLFYLDETYYK